MTLRRKRNKKILFLIKIKKNLWSCHGVLRVWLRAVGSWVRVHPNSSLDPSLDLKWVNAHQNKILPDVRCVARDYALEWCKVCHGVYNLNQGYWRWLKRILTCRILNSPQSPLTSLVWDGIEQGLQEEVALECGASVSAAQYKIWLCIYIIYLWFVVCGLREAIWWRTNGPGLWSS